MSLRVPLHGVDPEYLDGKKERLFRLHRLPGHAFNSEPSARPSIAAFDSQRIILHAMDDEGWFLTNFAVLSEIYSLFIIFENRWFDERLEHALGRRLRRLQTVEVVLPDSDSVSCRTGVVRQKLRGL